jgi:hypothetical protein
MFLDTVTLNLDENCGRLLAQMIGREIARLKTEANAARDRNDRDEWAFYTVQRRELGYLCGEIRRHLRALGAPTEAWLNELTLCVHRQRTNMPWSRANRSALERERATGNRSLATLAETAATVLRLTAASNCWALDKQPLIEEPERG